MKICPVVMLLLCWFLRLVQWYLAVKEETLHLCVRDILNLEQTADYVSLPVKLPVDYLDGLGCICWLNTILELGIAMQDETLVE